MLKRPAPVVDLHVPLVEIQLVVLAVVDAGGERVSRIAGHVVRQHEDDVRVRDPQASDGVVDREGVGYVAVVKPEARGAHLPPPSSSIIGAMRKKTKKTENGTVVSLLLRLNSNEWCKSGRRLQIIYSSKLR